MVDRDPTYSYEPCGYSSLIVPVSYEQSQRIFSAHSIIAYSGINGFAIRLCYLLADVWMIGSLAAWWLTFSRLRDYPRYISSRFDQHLLLGGFSQVLFDGVSW